LSTSLHQATRAWYETLSTYLLENGFRRGTIDKTLFIKTNRGDILLIQVYVDDIIFGSTKKSLCDEFEQMTHKRFQMSSIGELTFLLGLQVKQKDDGIFINQDKDSPFNLEAFFNSDYAGASLDKKSTTGGCQFLGKRLISWQCKKQTIVANSTTKAEYVDAASCCGQVLWIQNQMLDYGLNLMNIKIYIDNENLTFWLLALDYLISEGVFAMIQALVDGKKVVVNEASIRRDIRLDDAKGTACLPNAAIFEELARMSAKPTTWNEFNSTMASTIICLANNQKFNFSKYILENMVKNLEAGVKFFIFPRFIQVFVNHQLGTCFSKEITPLFVTMMVQASEEVGEIPTDAQNTTILTQPSSSQPQRKHKIRRKQRKKTEVLSLEQTKTNQAAEIKKLKKRIKKLEGKKKKRTHGLKRLYKVGLSTRIVSSDEEGLGDQEDASKQERSIADIDQDEGTTLVDDSQGRMNEEDLFRIHNLSGHEVFVDVTTGENIEQDATVAEKEVSTADPVIIAGEVVTTAENVKVAAAATTPQISKDELTLAQTLMEIKAAKPKAKGLKSKSFEEVQQAFNKNIDWVNNFVAIDSEAVKDIAVESSKRTGEELEQKSTKKHKLDEHVQAIIADDDDTKKLKRCLEIVPEDHDDVTIESTPLSSKSPTIVDYKGRIVEREQRIAKEKAAEQEAKDAALIEQMEDVQARMDEDVLLAERLQQEKREQSTVNEQARMLVDLIAERKRKKMVTYLKHMGKYTHNQLKSKSFEEIQMLYEREHKWINNFVPMDSEVVNDSEQQAKSNKKRSRADHDKESVKKQKLEEDDAEKEELRACLDIVLVDGIVINVESLATKYLIVDWKTHTQTENMMKYPLKRKMLSKMLNRRLEIDHESEMAFELIRFIKTQLKDVFGYILLVIKMLIMNKLDD
nr:putative ribonuclease H-like domain-containing protein [Tanacetum cinerariifolium]